MVNRRDKRVCVSRGRDSDPETRPTWSRFTNPPSFHTEIRAPAEREKERVRGRASVVTRNMNARVKRLEQWAITD